LFDFLIDTMHGEIPGEEKEDISLTPMAMPILAGPGAMSLAIGFSTHGPNLSALHRLRAWVCCHRAVHLDLLSRE
jgi:small neutral amino acid transporter SnatA (MarC family)